MIELRYGFNAKDFIKNSFEGRKWNVEAKIWEAPETAHNHFCRDYMEGVKVYKPYRGELNCNIALIPDAWNHQVKGAQHLVQRKRAILAAEPRTGKTLATIMALNTLKEEYCVALKILWVAPKSALWGLRNEFKKWGQECSLFITTYDSMHKYTDIEYDVVVFDEAHKLKNPSSARYAFAQEIANRTPYVFCLTGTPAPKDPTDIYGISEICCPGYINDKDRLTLASRLAHVTYEKSPLGHEYPKIGDWNHEAINKFSKELDGLVYKVLKKDCLAIPTKIYELRECTPTDEMDAILQVAGEMITNPLELLSLARQVSDGFAYVNTPNEETGEYDQTVEEFTSPKEEVLKDLLDEFEEGQRLVIYCGYIASVRKVARLVREKGWHTVEIAESSRVSSIGSASEIIQDFDASVPQKFNCNIAFIAVTDGACEGMELSRSPAIVYYSNTFNGGARMQSEERIISVNSRGSAIIDICCLPTDKYVRDNLINKVELQKLSLAEVKGWIK